VGDSLKSQTETVSPAEPGVYLFNYEVTGLDEEPSAYERRLTITVPDPLNLGKEATLVSTMDLEQNLVPVSIHTVDEHGADLATTIQWWTPVGGRRYLSFWNYDYQNVVSLQRQDPVGSSNMLI
jgi:hypothetical protein